MHDFTLWFFTLNKIKNYIAYEKWRIFICLINKMRKLRLLMFFQRSFIVWHSERLNSLIARIESFKWRQLVLLIWQWNLYCLILPYIDVIWFSVFTHFHFMYGRFSTDNHRIILPLKFCQICRTNLVLRKVQASNMQNWWQEINEKESNNRSIQVNNFVNIDFNESYKKTNTNKNCCINDLWNGNFSLLCFF